MSLAIGRWLREPLLLFLLTGLLLFVAYQRLNPRSAEADPGLRIELAAEDLEQIRLAWVAQGRPAPTAEELRSLVDARVREEILYREALALGLDEDDTIVRRRLAQKMEFLFEDVAALRVPTEGELRAWLEQHAERFTLPARASFRHLYFSPDRRGARGRDDALRALAELSGEPADAPEAAVVADPFMFQDFYGDRSVDEIARSFGAGFARELLDVAPGAWAGPLESGYGWHLVWVDGVAPAQAPAFEDVEPEVRRAWIEDQRAAIRERAFEAMRARYEVVLPRELDAPELASARTTGAPRPDGPP